MGLGKTAGKEPCQEAKVGNPVWKCQRPLKQWKKEGWDSRDRAEGESMRFCSTTVQEELTEEVDEDKSLKQGATALPWKTIDKMNHPLKDKKVHCILRTQEAYCWQTIAGSTCCMSVAFHFIHF